ncbi:MAG TPA: hypothetical protein VG944_23950, partial [Fimbriimonas sp.]|nr:hypothetical protein [Fimbriimonas sp.]
ANRRIIADKRLIAVFQHAGQKSDAFCAAQIKAARAQFYPADDSITVNSAGFNWSGKVSDLIHSEAGLATLFDRKVNTGNINLLPAVATQVASAHHCTSIDDLCACEREIVTGIKYRMDFTQDGTLSQPGGKRR